MRRLFPLLLLAAAPVWAQSDRLPLPAVPPPPPGMETRIVPQEGLHRLARFQRQKLAGAETAGVFPCHDFDKAIPAAGRE